MATMKMPCKKCLCLPSCINKETRQLWGKCAKIETFIKRQKGLWKKATGAADVDYFRHKVILELDYKGIPTIASRTQSQHIEGHWV